MKVSLLVLFFVAVATVFAVNGDEVSGSQTNSGLDMKADTKAKADENTDKVKDTAEEGIETAANLSNDAAGAADALLDKGKKELDNKLQGTKAKLNDGWNYVKDVAVNNPVGRTAQKYSKSSSYAAGVATGVTIPAAWAALRNNQVRTAKVHRTTHTVPARARVEQRKEVKVTQKTV